MSDKLTKYDVDQDKGTAAQYVKVVNPVILGMQIAIGMFIVFPLFIIATLIILTIAFGSFL